MEGAAAIRLPVVPEAPEAITAAAGAEAAVLELLFQVQEAREPLGSSSLRRISKETP